MNKMKLCVIFGGKSSEYGVSLHSVSSLLRQINNERYEVITVGISKQGDWYLYEGDIDHIEHDHWMEENCTPCVLSKQGLLKLQDGSYTTIAVDCVFPVLHGKNGEDGTLQGMLEILDIPYVGCDHLSSAICMDKEMMHIIAEHAGIPCAPYRCIYEDDPRSLKDIYDEASAALGLPLFIKPCNAGSSYGVHCVKSFEDFEEGIKDAFVQDGKGKVILEKTIEGFEIGCAVMGNRTLTVGSVDEIDIKGAFFDYEGKYEMKDAAIHCPARIDQDLFEQARALAAKAYRAMNCKGMTRVDMFVTPQHTIVFNELNTIPGFTATSRYPSMMKEIGIDFPELIDRLVDLAMEK